ncbi:MAG: hypothetical protein AAF492_19600 [Verrucomicrobiota bacterium]
MATNVPLSGTLYGAANGVAYAGGLFYVSDNGARSLHSVTPAGVVTLVGNTTNRFRNLASDGTTLFGLSPVGGGHLYEIDPTDASYPNAVPLGPSPTYRDMRSIARDPVSGILYGLTYPDYPALFRPTVLVEIDPLTGSFTNAVNLDVINLDELAFDAAGTLYGLASLDGGSLDPGELEGGTIAVINKTNGTVTAQPWATSRYRFLNQTFAYNSDDGLLYHVHPRPGDSQFVEMTTIDPVSGTVTPIATVLTNQSGRSPTGMTYDPDSGLFYVCLGDDFHSITTGGVATAINLDLAFPYDGHGMAVLPDLRLSIDVSSSGNGVNLNWDSYPNRRYGLYSRTNLTAGSWTPVAGGQSITSTPPMNVISNLPLPSVDRGYFVIGPPSDD